MSEAEKITSDLTEMLKHKKYKKNWINISIMLQTILVLCNIMILLMSLLY